MIYKSEVLTKILNNSWFFLVELLQQFDNRKFSYTEENWQNIFQVTGERESGQRQR